MNLLDLPQDLLLYAAFRALNPPNIRRLALTNSKLHSILNSQRFWQFKLEHDFPMYRGIQMNTDVRKTYKVVRQFKLLYQL